MKSGFIDRLLDVYDKVDSRSMQSHFLRLIKEKGLLETIFQSIQEGVVVVDVEGRIRYLNRMVESLFGIRADEAINRSIKKYITVIDWDSLLDFELSEWSKLINKELEIDYPEHKFLSFYIVPLKKDNDKISDGAVIIFRDITAQRINESSTLETERFNAIKLLAAGVAHEIGNPLNALNIHLQLLGREFNKISKDVEEGRLLDIEDIKELSELINVASSEVSRLDLIINQFLKAVRPTKPRFELMYIDSVLEETLAFMKHEIQNRELKVEVVKDRHLSKLNIDKDQMKQAFFNIIKNAFQAIPDKGSLIITISEDYKYQTLSFRDNGKGISKVDMSKIFDPYYTTKSSGSGLGLMVVQRIVREHGGMIEVNSKENMGTEIRIMLPLFRKKFRLLKK